MAPKIGNKMGNKMAALCSVAIGAIYIAGYVVTEPKELNAASVLPITAPTASSVPTFGPVATPNATPLARQTERQRTRPSDTYTTTPTSTPMTVPKAGNAAAKYKDGTYTGQGSNRIGGVQVAVTIKNGKIASVEITKCTTHYSQSYIDKMPEQVVARQSDQVDVVSGATKSTEDFQVAVRQALQQAQA